MKSVQSRDQKKVRISRPGETVEEATEVTSLIQSDDKEDQRWIGTGLEQRSFNSGKLRYPSSLDFERVVNDYSIQAALDCMAEESEKLIGHKKALARWIFTLATGLMTGIISISIVSVTDSIQRWRSGMVDEYWAYYDQGGSDTETNAMFRRIPFFAIYALANLTLALLSAGLCLYFAPEAVGSGIPEVKAYLNGVRVKRFSSARLFFVKLVATILSVSSGLAIGPEGPLVHMGAIVGASCTKVPSFLLRVLPKQWSSRLWSAGNMDLSNFSTDGERRDLVSIGAAAGFAAAFGAPIGGILFTMEEASSYFEQSMFMKTLVATAIATFCLAVHHGDLSDYSIISLNTYQTPDGNIFSDRVEQLPLYAVVAAGGGLLGGCFCRMWKLIQLNRRRIPSAKRRRYNIIEVSAVSLITSTLCYFLPKLNFVYCREIPSSTLVRGLSDLWLESAHQFDCPHGQINELATIIFGSRESAISSILSDPAQFSLCTLITVGLLFFPLMTMTLGVSLPSGIFMPTILIGCSFGGAAGIVFENMFEKDMSISTFSLLGAAALLAGIQRSTVSLCVILVEGTGQVKVLIPVIITVLIARYVGDLVSHHGLYEIAIEVNGYPFLDHATKKRSDVLTAGQVMSSPVVTLKRQETAKDLAILLQKYDHHGFPVVDDNGNFLGLVRRDQIAALLECGIFQECVGLISEDEDELERVEAPETDDWSPKPGIGKSSLMHLAFHIGDDRYDHLPDGHSSFTTITSEWNEDDFDANAWLVSIRQSRNFTSTMGDETLPPTAPSYPLVKKRSITHASSFGSTRSVVAHGTFATVATNRKGNVYVSWLEPSFAHSVVDLAAVMNKGAFTVLETTPLSKAHVLFTRLGLRHLVVLGNRIGSTDDTKTCSQVVGVITRVNLLRDNVEEKTRSRLK